MFIALMITALLRPAHPCGAGNADKADWSLLAGKNVIIWPDNDAQGFVYQNVVIGILKQLEPAVRISVIDPTSLDLQEKEDCSDFAEQCKTLKTHFSYCNRKGSG